MPALVQMSRLEAPVRLERNLRYLKTIKQDAHEFPEIMKKNKVLANFILEGTLTVFVIS